MGGYSEFSRVAPNPDVYINLPILKWWLRFFFLEDMQAKLYTSLQQLL